MHNRSYFINCLTNRTRAAIGTLALGTAALLLPACQQPVDNITTEDVVEETEQLIGQTVTVRNEVEEAVGDASFILESDELIGGEPILVVNATGTSFVLPPEDDTPVQVTGEVAQFVIADIEQEYGLELDETVYADYVDRPVIIAQSLALAPEPEELAEDPAAFYNRVVAVEGEVAELYASGAFTIGEEGWFSGGELLVVGVNPDFGAGESAVEEGENVTVVGVLRPFVTADFERDYDLQWDLDLVRQIEAEYTSKPVLAATEVYLSAVEQ